MNVELEKSVAEDLVTFKLNAVQSEIESILKKWDYSYIEDFVSDVKAGKIDEGENDAIDLQNLADKLLELKQLQEKIRG